MFPEQTHNDEDWLLVRKTLRGDTEAFREIIKRQEKLVAGIVFKMVKHPGDRQDLCQDIFLKAFERLHSFRFQSKFSTWLGAIAFNHCVNHLRQRKQQVDTPPTNDCIGEGKELQLSSSLKKPDEQLLDSEIRIVLQQCLETLSGVQQTIIHLFHMEGLSLQEISVLTSLPVNTVKSHLFRARTILKKRLNRYLKD